MTQEEQATVLARWLSGPPGTPPPSELDPEVVESVYALRPDLAPPADLDLDDLLGSVTTGPLAAPGAQSRAPAGAGGEVVPFPAAPPTAEARPAPSGARGWARWATVAVGGTSGLGLLVAAAAVLLFVALPASRELPGESEPSPAAGAPALLAEPEAARSAPAPAPAAEPPTAPMETITARAPAARLDDAGGAPPADDAPTAAVPMQRGTVWRDQTTIPELAAKEQDAVAVADELEAPAAEAPTAPAKPSAAPVAAEEDQRKKVEAGPVDPRGAAVPRDLAANGWRRGLDKATQQVFDAALTEGEALVRSGDSRGGGDRLAAAVGAPPRAGQLVAARAAAAYLAARDPAAAEAVARRGLALSSENTPERSALLVALGDARQAAGDAAGAEAVWREAATANAAR